jgi:hypothetical protein
MICLILSEINDHCLSLGTCLEKLGRERRIADASQWTDRRSGAHGTARPRSRPAAPLLIKGLRDLDGEGAGVEAVGGMLALGARRGRVGDLARLQQADVQAGRPLLTRHRGRVLRAEAARPRVAARNKEYLAYKCK